MTSDDAYRAMRRAQGWSEERIEYSLQQGKLYEPIRAAFGPAVVVHVVLSNIADSFQ